MVHDPLGILDALMIAVSGFFIVFLMLAVLWGIIVIVSRAVGAIAPTARETMTMMPQSTASMRKTIKKPETAIMSASKIPRGSCTMDQFTSLKE